jgi:tetratricopeptide (TPR) repeat protein
MKGLRAALAVGFSVAVLGCASTPGERMMADVKSFQADQKPELLFERGKAFAAVGDMTRAEEYLAAAMDAGYDPRKVMPLLLDACTRDNRYRVAIQYAQNYLRRYPGDMNTWFVVGTLHAAMGEAAPAEEALLRVQKVRPEDPNVQFALGVLYRDLRADPVRADAHFRAYLRLAPNGEHVGEARANLLKQVQPEGAMTPSSGPGPVNTTPAATVSVSPPFVTPAPAPLSSQPRSP